MNIYIVQWSFKKFCKGDKSLEDKECSGWPLEADNEQWRGSLKLILLQLHEKLPKSTTLWSSDIWSKLERWKSGCLKLTTNQKNTSFSSVVFSYSMQQWTIFWPDCDMLHKVDFTQPAMTSSVGGPGRSPKALTEAKLTPNKGPCSLFGDLMLVWSTTASWIPAKPLHLRSMLSKSIRSTTNCNASSQHWSREKAQFFSTTPNSRSYNQRFKSWTNWATRFCLICCIHLTSHQLTTTSSSISTIFLWGKCFPRVHQILKHGCLCYRNKQTYFSLAKMCWLWWFLFWLIKMCLSLVIMGPKP